MRKRLAGLAGRAVSEVSRLLGTGQGSAIGGHVFLASAPGPWGCSFAGRRVGLVSGTNGNTTTTCLLAAALTTAGEVSTLGGAPTSCPASWAPSPLPGRCSYAALKVDEGLLRRSAGTRSASAEPIEVRLLSVRLLEAVRNSTRS